jgi:hypothetical protein
MLIEPEQLHVEYLIGVATSGDIIAWACQALADAFATNDIVCEIASLNTSDRYERERAAALPFAARRAARLRRQLSSGRHLCPRSVASRMRAVPGGGDPAVRSLPARLSD